MGYILQLHVYEVLSPANQLSGLKNLRDIREYVVCEPCVKRKSTGPTLQTIPYGYTTSYTELFKNVAYSRLHNGLYNGFFKTFLVMFEQDPKCRTQAIFGCLERVKAAAGEVCHLL